MPTTDNSRLVTVRLSPRAQEMLAELRFHLGAGSDSEVMRAALFQYHSAVVSNADNG